MVTEFTGSQVRPERLITSPKARRWRDSRVKYHDDARYHHRYTPSLSSTSRTPGSSSLPNNGPVQSPVSSGQQPNLETLNYSYFSGSNGNYTFGPNVIHQNEQVGNLWHSPSLPLSHTLASQPHNSLQSIDEDSTGFLSNALPAHIPGNGLDTAWNGAAPCTRSSDIDDMSMPDFPYGSYESLDSMALDTPNTATSSISGSYVFPVPGSEFGSPRGMSQVADLALPDEYFQMAQPFDSPSPCAGNPSSPLDVFNFEGDYTQFQSDCSAEDIYLMTGPQLSTNTLTQYRSFVPEIETHSIMLQAPWNSQQAEASNFAPEANAGCIAFEPERGIPYRTHIAREEYLDARQQSNFEFLVPEAMVLSESEDESWQYVSSDPGSYAPSHNSPHSPGSPLSGSASPVLVDHTHVFTTHLEVEKQKTTRGRQRNLTAQEKRQAREVREAKACWACHLSKTKCSPCSPGKPCEQCTRLTGKRRFCKFSCFNDPLESLFTLLVPEYLNGHFSKENVEAFVAKNASRWGSHNMCVRMTWGYHKLLEANVVDLVVRDSNSQIGFSHQAVFADGKSRPSLQRRKSPPLGIPLAAMMEMQDVYTAYILDIVKTGLPYYPSTAYDDQKSKLPERLLAAICKFYSEEFQAGRECGLIRQAIEMHITSTILERSLILDAESIRYVENYLKQDYHPRAVPRCAQRQIKLALFMIHRQRIIDVLREWGNKTWTIKNSASNQAEWATSFSVFLLLTLVIDKVFGSAYYFCEGRIEYHGSDARSEREQLEQLVTLAQRELFERCKEIFHWKFKTRKGGKEACNPIRDGLNTFRGKDIEGRIEGLVLEVQTIVREFRSEIKAHRSSRVEPSGSEGRLYTDAGRLACIFLDDFLDH